MARKQQIIKDVVAAAKEKGTFEKGLGKSIRAAVETRGMGRKESRLYKRAGRMAAGVTTKKEGMGVTKFLTNADKRSDRKARKPRGAGGGR